MSAYKRSLLVISLLVFVSLFSVEKVFAAEHKLEDLHIHVFIKNNGSAEITERRVAHLSEGTENYIIIENLGDSEIKHFVVREDGKTYQSVKNWDIDASQADKEFKKGIIETKDGYELSWGIGDYGDHEYTLEYTVTNFIKQLEDSQILFWRFVNDQTNIPPENVTVEIETEEELDEQNEKIWGFGFDGEINFRDGKVISTSNQPLTNQDYVTILIKFSDGMFSAKDHLDKTFEEVKDEAFIGSDYGEDAPAEDNKSNNSLYDFLFGSYEAKVRNIIIGIIATMFIISMFFKPSLKMTKKKPKKYRRSYRGEYYRDYPYADNFLDVYYLLYVMGVSNFEKVLTAFILKWINEDRISVDTEDIGFLSKKNVSAIHFIDKEMEISSREGKLFHMLVEAADSKDVLKENEFAAWARRNTKQLIKWEKNVINESLQILENEEYVQLEVERKFLIKREIYVSTDKGIELEKKIHQYVNYLYDYSLLNEHEAINVKIWDEIMIWAAVLGLTKVVRRQFKKLYPTYDEETVYTGGALYLTSSFSESTSEARTESRFSGGGGSTSSGGGGGSFGGGSGGGTR